jgi:hypothetical protein
MEAGLKILVSAVQSRPSPPFFSAICLSGNFSRTDFVPRFVPNSGTLQCIPVHEDGGDAGASARTAHPTQRTPDPPGQPPARRVRTHTDCGSRRSKPSARRTAADVFGLLSSSKPKA